MTIDKYLVISVTTTPEELEGIAADMRKELEIPHIKRLGKSTIIRTIHMSGVSIQFSYNQETELPNANTTGSKAG